MKSTADATLLRMGIIATGNMGTTKQDNSANVTVQSFLLSVDAPMFQGAKRLNTEGGPVPQWLTEAYPTRWTGTHNTNDSDSIDGPTQPEGVT
jgi:hypothetical protein